MDNIQEYILQSIDILLDKKIDNLHFDKTYDGMILESSDNGYYVGVAGKKINAETSSTYSAGDLVKVHIPLNNWNNAYID